MFKTSVIYVLLTLFCILFNFIYSIFGHGVSSAFMTYMFLIPLILGFIPYLLLGLTKKHPKRLEYNLYNCGIITLLVGSLINGILEIAGTNTIFQNVYYIIGICLIVISTIIFIINLNK